MFEDGLVSANVVSELHWHVCAQRQQSGNAASLNTLEQQARLSQCMEPNNINLLILIPLSTYYNNYKLYIDLLRLLSIGTRLPENATKCTESDHVSPNANTGET